MERFAGSRVALLLAWLPPLAWMAVIFRLSAIPGSDVPSRYATLAHLLAYGLLGALLTLPLGRGRTRGETVALSVLVASLYGITDEFHQRFVPMRTPDVTDWGVDTLGAFAGALVAISLAAFVRRLADKRAGTSQ